MNHGEIHWIIVTLLWIVLMCVNDNWVVKGVCAFFAIGSAMKFWYEEIDDDE